MKTAKPKIFALTLALVLMLTLAACGDSNTPNGNTPTPSPTQGGTSDPTATPDPSPTPDPDPTPNDTGNTPDDFERLTAELNAAGYAGSFRLWEDIGADDAAHAILIQMISGADGPTGGYYGKSLDGVYFFALGVTFDEDTVKNIAVGVMGEQMPLPAGAEFYPGRFVIYDNYLLVMPAAATSSTSPPSIGGNTPSGGTLDMLNAELDAFPVPYTAHDYWENISDSKIKDDLANTGIKDGTFVYTIDKVLEGGDLNRIHHVIDNAGFAQAQHTGDVKPGQGIIWTAASGTMYLLVTP
ncbi:MAG: hypothetical protein LBI19_06555 [Oscillospiraceae bacterium]|nr:hypothetical protein [Oscillospiraceae bacterium]